MSLARLPLPALAVALPLLLASGCVSDHKITPADTGHDLDNDADTDTDTDTDADTDADTDTDTQPDLVSVDARLVPDVTTITTRDTVSVVVTATWSDGSTSDMTAASTIASSDTDTVRFFTHDVAQPLTSGSVEISVTPPDGTALPALPLAVTMATVQPGDLVFNEILADPATTADPNRDGDSDPVDDEFLEIANAADAAVDLSGTTLWDADLSLARHTFPSPTILGPGEAIVIFGGGSVANLSAAYVTFVVADNEDHSLQYGVALNNEGDAPTLIGPDGTTVIATAPYGDEGGPAVADDASLVLAPEVYGTSYTNSNYASGSTGPWSPGTHADGSAFEGPGVFAP